MDRRQDLADKGAGRTPLAGLWDAQWMETPAIGRDWMRPAALAPTASRLVDGFGRSVTYLHMSVTDRCDLRRGYGLAKHTTFLPKADVLSIAELDRLAASFVGLGLRNLRLTGGEPLVRPGFLDLVARLSRHLRSGQLDELTVTTNGAQLKRFAADLGWLGVRRITVSLDTLDAKRFHRLTRGGDLAKVLAGIEAALDADIEVKINTVALKGENAGELPNLIDWAHGLGADITLIETMPMGAIGEDRTDQFMSLQDVRRDLASFWTLTDLDYTTGEPARYVRVEETGGRLGFITPLSLNFREACNRVRLTCTGMLHTCLGHEEASDLRAVIRSGADDARLEREIFAAIGFEAQGHDLQIDRSVPAVRCHMSTTGG